MKRRVASFLFSIIVLLLLLNDANARERELLFSKSLSPGLREIAGNIQDTRTKTIDYEKLTWSTGYFVRIASRSNIISESGRLNDAIRIRSDARLGTKPFIFLTSPESIYGRSLFDIYKDIGYEAEEIINMPPDKDMVAVVFRYPEEIVLDQHIKYGMLAHEWKRKVYIPYWDNIFSLFHLLAEGASIEPEKARHGFAPERLFFSSRQERAFVLNYPQRGKSRIKRTSYGELKAIDGADWEYRRLLKDKLSIMEHFRGNGRTQNEVDDPDGRMPGLVEFVGPNQKIMDLPEVAIIDLGRLTITVSPAAQVQGTAAP